jgi:tetratricopeptide (TPR) repeat protein
MITNTFSLSALLFLVLYISACAPKYGQSKKISDPELLYNIAQDFTKQGKFINALSALAEAEAISRDNFEIINLQGFIYLLQNNLPFAEEKFLAATHIKEDYSEGWVNLGQVYIQQGKWDQAIKACQNALKNLLYFTPYEAYNIMGWAYFNLKQLDDATAAFQNALSSNPNYIVAVTNLGLTFLEAGKTAEALAQYERAEALCHACPAGTRANLLWLKSSVYKKKGEKQKAISLLKTCQTLDNSGPSGNRCKNDLQLLITPQ